MKQVRISTIALAGLAVALLGTAMPQVSMADSYYRTYTFTRTVTTPVAVTERPVMIEKVWERPALVERVVEQPVMLERVIEKPVMVEKVLERPVVVEKIIETPKI